MPHRDKDQTTIYLDFDGVLHRSLCSPEEYFSRLSVMEPLIGHNFAIVISSSWRFQYPMSVLASYLGVLGQKVVGCTGPAVEGRHSRWHEIRHHAVSHSITRWMIVDDSAYEFPQGARVINNRLVLCNAATGITGAEVGMIISLLQR